MKKFLLGLLIALLLIPLCVFSEPVLEDEISAYDGIAYCGDIIIEYGYDYSLPDEVGLYLHAFRELPPNFLTKREAQDLGWRSSDGNLWDVAYGLSIGGDKFGNREGLLPDTPDRQWYECDVNYEGGYRGAERILFSNDGMVCYSPDHYNSYELMYETWYDYGDGISHEYGDFLDYWQGAMQ